MFQDDKMIPMLTAIVVMIALGAVIQRADGISEYITEPDPAPILVEDSVPVVAGKLRRIDVFANDRNITDTHRQNLRVAGQPACGQVFVQDGTLQYLAEDSCAGRQQLVYTVDGSDPPVAGQVVAYVQAQSRSQPLVRRRQQNEQAAPQPSPEDALALVEDAPRQPRASVPVVEDADQTAPSLAEVLANGAADTADAAQPEIVPVLPNPAANDDDANEGSSAKVEALAPQRPTDSVEVIDLTNVQKQPAEAVETLLTEQDGGAAQEQLENQETTLALVQPTAPVAEPRSSARLDPEEPALSLAPVKHFQPAAPGALLSAPRIDKIDRSTDGSPQIAPAPRFEGATGDTGVTDFMVAVIPLSEPKTSPPADLGVRTVIDRRSPNLRQDSDSTETRLELAAITSDGRYVDQGLGPALRGDLVDKDQPPLSASLLPAELHPIPRVRDTAALQAANQAEQDVGQNAAAPELKDEPAEPTQLAALPAATTPCVAPPATTIDVGRAAESTISIIAPCHANTIAELTYSGLRFAVPLNGDGKGKVKALGFESNSAALLIFDNGEKIDFDLPFKGVKRVARVALVWDMPVNLELNAFEFGAKTGDESHIWAGNPRSFRDIRKSGGGYLTTYRSHSGVGQNVQVYSHYTRNGGESGIVKLMIDFASRNRDLLDGTCGDGQYASPQFLVMRSEDGRKERPVLRKLASMACSDVPAEKGDKRLISGAVADLVISR